MNNKKLSIEDIDNLREKIRPYLKEKRYLHTLSVEKEADRLGNIYIPEDRIRLRAAALLHDITKREDYANQLNYLRSFGIIEPSFEESSPEILHAITGAILAGNDFGDYVDEDILSAIRWHTTGHEGMTLFETIIYFADFIEETRRYSGCIELRNDFYRRIESGEDKYLVLYESVVSSLDMTISHLKAEDIVIDTNTLFARNYFMNKTEFLAKGGKNNENVFQK